MPNGQSVPPVSYSWSWVREEFNKKADEKWVESEIKALEKAAKDTKGIALSAKKKTEEPHVCIHERTLTDINTAVASWSNWWRGVIITVIATIIILGTALGGWWYSHLLLETTVENTTERVEKLDVAVKGIKASQEDLKVAFETSEQRRVNDAKEQLETMKGNFKAILNKITVERAPRGRRAR